MSCVISLHVIAFSTWWHNIHFEAQVLGLCYDDMIDIFWFCFSVELSFNSWVFNVQNSASLNKSKKYILHFNIFCYSRSRYTPMFFYSPYSFFFPPFLSIVNIRAPTIFLAYVQWFGTLTKLCIKPGTWQGWSNGTFKVTCDIKYNPEFLKQKVIYYIT